MTARTAGPAPAGINFGDSSFYSGAAFVPDGDYIVYHKIMLYDGNEKSRSRIQRLGVMVDFYPLATPTDDHKVSQFYSMGSKAKDSYMPNDAGTGLVPVPGGPGGNLNDKTNWNMYRDSFLQCGLPPGIFTDDISVLDGAWVRITNVDEPAERASYQSSGTAEGAAEPRRAGKVAVITEILEGGMPWEGGGGIPETAPAKKAPAKPAVKATAKPAAPTATARPAAKPTAKPAEDVDSETIKAQAMDCISEVIGKAPNGLPRIKLQNDTFAEAKKKFGEEVASQVADLFFMGQSAGENLPNLLGELGYTINGPMVKPAA